MAQVTDITPILLDKKDRATMVLQLDEYGKHLADMQQESKRLKLEINVHWGRVEAMELMMCGLRKILKD